MTDLVAPFVPVHGSWTFLPDMNCLLDPSGRSIRLSVNYRHCRPTDHMITRRGYWHRPAEADHQDRGGGDGCSDCSEAGSAARTDRRSCNATARVQKKYNVPCAMEPWVTLKNVLVHPKDRGDKEQTTQCVYKVSCASCEKTYIGETGRKLGSGYKNTDLKSRKRIELSPEVVVQVHRLNLIDRH